VLCADTGEPLPAAKLEVWQTDSRGLYSNASGLWPRRWSRKMWLRGRFFTDAEGAYALRTIEPAHYPLGRWSRPRHLHFLVTHERCEPLVTQLYFRGDPLLRRDRFARPPLILEPQEGEATFDFALMSRR